MDDGFVMLGEAVAWIAWRGREPPYDEEWARVWQASGLAWLANGAKMPPGQEVEHQLWQQWDEAIKKLRTAAHREEIVGCGQKCGYGELAKIPPGAWIGEIDPLHNTLSLAAPNGLPERTPTWQNVGFDAREHLRLAANLDAPRAKPAVVPAADAELKDWLGRPEIASLTVPELRQAATEEFGDRASYRRIDALREPRRPGRRRKT